MPTECRLARRHYGSFSTAQQQATSTILKFCASSAARYERSLGTPRPDVDREGRSTSSDLPIVPCRHTTRVKHHKPPPHHPRYLTTYLLCYRAESCTAEQVATKKPLTGVPWSLCYLYRSGREPSVTFAHFSFDSPLLSVHSTRPPARPSRLNDTPSPGLSIFPIGSKQEQVSKTVMLSSVGSTQY